MPVQVNLIFFKAGISFGLFSQAFYREMHSSCPQETYNLVKRLGSPEQTAPAMNINIWM